MSGPKIELPAWNRRQKNAENRLEDIHFLVEQIHQISYGKTQFEVLLSETENAISQENFLKYAQLLYNFCINHKDLEFETKNKTFIENDHIVYLVSFLEDMILKNYMDIVEINLSEETVKLRCSVDAFNNMEIFNFNIEYLDFKLDDNLKVGITKCINGLYYTDSGDLFDSFAIDFELGYFNDEEDCENYSKKEVALFTKTTKKYQEKFNKYLGKKYNQNKVYTAENDIYIQNVINYIINYDDYLIRENIEEGNNGECSFQNMFTPVLFNINPLCDAIFSNVEEDLCRSLGEVGVEYISQYIIISKDSITNSVSQEEIKELQLYQKNISELCKILFTYGKEE